MQLSLVSGIYIFQELFALFATIPRCRAFFSNVIIGASVGRSSMAGKNSPAACGISATITARELVLVD